MSSTKSNFGSKGWLMILVAGLMFYFYAGMCTDGLNTIVNNFAEAHGLQPADILSWTTPASWVGLIGAVVASWFIDRKSNRLCLLISAVLGGISYMFYGVVNNLAGFTVVTALANFFGMGYCWTCANALMASWFPTRKGLALGWATMGQNLCSATFILLLTAFMGMTSLNGSFYIMGALLVVAGIFSFIVMRDTPEELGCAPDNGAVSKEELEAAQREMKEYKSPWSPKALLTNKQIWLIGIGYGLYIICNVSLISQMIPRLIMTGLEPPVAIGSMTVAALLGLLGSYGTGWLDQKLGTKKASIVYGFWYLLTLACCIIPSNSLALAYFSVFCTGIAIGGIGNLFPSMTATVFGRYDFVRAMGVLNPITNIVRSFTFVIIGFGLGRTGNYHLSYALVAGLCVVGIVLISLIDEKKIGK
ncbi:MAG: MFS transporter [Oscillospiraceae bacterium]|nr:MFS transporter [Oscillospiraceae bacterium]